MPHADSAMIPEGIDKDAFWAHVHDQLSHLLAGQRDWVRPAVCPCVSSFTVPPCPRAGHPLTSLSPPPRSRTSQTPPRSSTTPSSPSPSLAPASAWSTGAVRAPSPPRAPLRSSSLTNDRPAAPPPLPRCSLLAGFYLTADLFPAPRLAVAGTAIAPAAPAAAPTEPAEKLLLGPFCGRPACQLISVAPGRARGVCAAAFLARRAVLVPDVDAYPGHIACDGETRSEVVCPLVLRLPAAGGGGAAEGQGGGEEGEGKGEREAALGVLDLDCLALGGFDERDRAGLEKIAQLVVDACDW